jgi:4-aminobutyrate aminotransferase-like enzyme
MHGQLPVVWDKAMNDLVWDINGKKYIDFTSGICVANVGHTNPKLFYELEMQAQFLMHSYTFYTEIRAKFLEYLIKHTPKFIEKAFLVSSGTEACECAIKLMKMYGGRERDQIISFTGAMHGRTLGAEFLKGKAHWIGSWWPEVIHLPFPSTYESHEYGKKPVKKVDTWKEWVEFKHINPNKVCGIMFETYQGWSARFYPKKYVQDAVKWAKSNKVLVCFDEIQGGMGRTGKLFNYMHYGVEPDLVCVGKGFSSSVPLSGVLGRKWILDIPKVGSMSSTHSANPLCCAVGLANFKEILRVLPEVKTKGNFLHRELRKQLPRYRINGKGLVAGIIMHEKHAEEACYEAMRNGLLVIKTGTSSVKVAPPLTIEKKNLKKGIDILCKAIKKTQKKSKIYALSLL